MMTSPLIRTSALAAAAGSFSLAAMSVPPQAPIAAAEGGLRIERDAAVPVESDSGEPRGMGNTFVNWETPHVHPLALTPDGSRLLAVNTPDARLEIFDVFGGSIAHSAVVPVGIDPVTVRARSSTQAWVVNHVSDSISIVDLGTMNVVATIRTLDEPCDVVFAGSGANERAFVSCSQVNTIQVFNPNNLAAAPTNIPVLGEDPRALAVSPDGSKVYAAIFESGNHSTIIGGGGMTGGNIAFPPNAVDDQASPYFNAQQPVQLGINPPNPPPNAGNTTMPPRNGAAGTPPRVSLIVKKFGNQWMDDNNGDWTEIVSGAAVPPSAFNRSGRLPGWDLYDHDLAVIDTSTLGVTYADGLMNLCMAMSVRPSDGRICVVGTDATNEVRFEPNVNGTFVRVHMAAVNPADLTSSIVDLNPHLDYSVSTINQADRDRSIGDPRAIVWDSGGTLGYVAGMGSNTVIAIDANGARAGFADVIPVAEGPTGLVLDEPSSRLYVLSKFAGRVSVVDTSSRAVVQSVGFFDPSPAAIKLGRKHLYDTHKNSGLGQSACASCHVDGRMDRLAWDLGDPSGILGPVSSTNRNLGANLPGLNTGFTAYHPMKGPMTTQTMQDIIGKEPHHWRGDRLGLEEFNGAFIGLQGDDTNLTPTEMQEFENFLATITFPPNPFRNFDNTLPTSLPLPGHFTTGRFAAAGLPLPNGNAVNGLTLYRRPPPNGLDGGALSCVICHTLPTGAGTDYRFNGATQYLPIPPGNPAGNPNGDRHLMLVSVDGLTNITMKVPQTRNIHEKAGFNATQLRNLAGFGVLHDGSVDSIERFVSEPAFNPISDQQVADLTALMLAFSGSELPMGSPTNIFEPPGPLSKDTHAAVGQQTTINGPPSPETTALINSMLLLRDQNKAAVIVKGKVNGQQRGYMYRGGMEFQSDRTSSILTAAQVLALAAPGTELTYTVVPRTSATRAGIDRDSDGWYDRDELDVCSDPANAAIRPGTARSIDVNGDLTVSTQDLFDFLALWFGGAGDFNGDGLSTTQDLFDFLSRWFGRC